MRAPSEVPAYVVFHNSTLAEIVRPPAAEPERSSPRCRASARRSSSASAEMCSPSSVGRLQVRPRRGCGRFLAELDLREPAPKPVEPDDPLYETLKRWRLETAQAEARPAYVIFHNSTLAEIVRRGPRSREELAAVPGVGPAKLERYGDELLAVLASA